MVRKIVAHVQHKDYKYGKVLLPFLRYEFLRLMMGNGDNYSGVF